jgi:hypothetical protein
MPGPPQPIAQPAKSSGPIPVAAAARRPQQSSGPAAGAFVVAPESYPPAQPQLIAPREKMLVCGDSYAGKSYTWAQIAERMFLEDKGKPQAQRRSVFVIDTDLTTPKFLGPGFEFEHLYFGNGGNVYPYPATTYAESASAVAGIMAKQRRDDWIAVDVVNRWNDQVRETVAHQKGFEREDKAVERLQKQQGFGEFDNSGWTLVGIAHDSLVGRLIFRCEAHLLLLSHLTDYVDIREKRDLMLLFDQVGVKPQARPSVYKAVDTVVVLWARVLVPRNERGARLTTERARIQRVIQVIKDRGEPYAIRDEFDKDFYTKLQEIRKRTDFKPANVFGIEADDLIDVADAVAAETTVTPETDFVNGAGDTNHTDGNAGDD